MSQIPEDVEKAALDAWLSVPTADWEQNAVEVIARALLAERRRCAVLAFQMLQDEFACDSDAAIYAHTIEQAILSGKQP